MAEKKRVLKSVTTFKNSQKAFEKNSVTYR